VRDTYLDARDGFIDSVARLGLESTGRVAGLLTKRVRSQDANPRTY
jgi:hypothetical protein